MSRIGNGNDIVIMSPTVNRAVYEWKTFLSRQSAIVKKANKAGLYVELLNGQKIYFKGETEGPSVLLGRRADIVTVDEFKESEVMQNEQPK